MDDSASPREAMCISGLWRFQPDPSEAGMRQAFYSRTADTSGWLEVAVPASFEDCHPSLTNYEGLGWFVRTVSIPDSWRGRRVVLRLEGANYRSRAWVNGHEVGYSADGFLRSEYAVDDALDFGRRDGNLTTIAIAVDGARYGTDVPGRERGWRPYGGILRDVFLVVTPRVWLDRPWVVAEPGKLTFTAHVVNDTDASVTVDPRLGLTACADGQALTIVGLGAEWGASVTVEPRSAHPLKAEVMVPQARNWTPDDPVLYKATATLSSDAGVGGMCIDECSVRTGFRCLAATPDELLLNGTPIFLKGFNRHEDSPETGMCADAEQVAADLKDMKALGCNFVRLCHYPHDPLELDLCDELGLLVMCEIPLYWWAGEPEGLETSAAKLAAAKRQARRMVLRDRNHPCVAFWSVSNENRDDSPGVNSGNAELLQLVKGLDPTRLATRVSDKWTKHTTWDGADVLCVNGYPTWHWRLMEHHDDYSTATASEWWRRELTELHARNSGRPILVTEFGFPALHGVSEGSAGELLQAEAISVEFTGIRACHGVVGAVVWCYADHPWPEEDFLKYVTTSPFGVVSRGRLPKPAYEVVRGLFGGAQPAAAREDDYADPPIEMACHDLRNHPHHAFPDGYTVRPMRASDASLWEDILRDSGHYWPDGRAPSLFEREFGRDPSRVCRQSVLIVDDRGVAVGTVTAWSAPQPVERMGPTAGRVRWLAIRPQFRDNDLARPALGWALHALARQHTVAEFTIASSCLTGIRAALDLGFTPALPGPREAAVWRKVEEALRPRLTLA